MKIDKFFGQIQTAQSKIQDRLPSLSIMTPSFVSTFAQKMIKLKNKKISIVNEHIKMRIKRDIQYTQMKCRQPLKINTSMQIPSSLKTRHHRIASTNTNNFLMQLLSPNNKTTDGKNDQNSIRSRQKSISSKKSGSQNRSSKLKSRQVQQNQHYQYVRYLQNFIDQDTLEKRLSNFSKQQGRNSLRIYKQDIHKIILQRYNRDRITTFLDTQYIQDFNSVLKTMKELVSLKKQQMLILVFIIIDQNKDGLITPQDLNNLLGLRRQVPPTFNPLIMHDIIKINNYVQHMKQQGDLVMDTCSSPILKDQALTFMKYRISNYKSKKNTNRNVSKPNKFLSVRLHNHLFCLQTQKQENKDDKFSKNQQNAVLQNIFLVMLKNNKRKIKNQFTIGEHRKFAINFDRFCQIFQSEIPKIFLDFLYMFGGLQVPDQGYLPVDSTMLFKSIQPIQKIVIEEDKMNLTHRRVAAMHQFNKQFKIFKLKTIS